MTAANSTRAVATNAARSANMPSRLVSLRHFRTVILVLALCGGFVAIGSQRQSTGPASGHAFVGQVTTPVATTSRSFRVGTFNIHGGCGTDGVVDLDRTIACVQGCDFLGLNEVRDAGLSTSDNQAALIAAALGQTSLFAPTERRWWHSEYGNAAVTRLEVKFWQRIPLTRGEARAPRNVVLSGVEIAGQRVQILTTHLDRSHTPTRLAQLATVTSLFLALQPPALLVGDLNSTREDEPLAKCLIAKGVVDALAQRPNDNAQRIDWIIARGVRVIEVGEVDRGASDHPHYWALLEVLE